MDTSDTAYGLASVLFAGLGYAGLLLAFRRSHAGLTDVFSINALYVAFGTAGLFGYGVVAGNSVAVMLVALVGVWLAGMWVGTRLPWHRFSLAAPAFRGRSAVEQHQQRRHDVAAMALIVLVYATYAYSLLSDGLLLSGEVDLTSRFLLVQENKVQAYFLGAVTFAPAVILFRLRPDLKVPQVALRLLPFGLLQAATLSKTGMISILVFMLVYYGLQVRHGYRQRPSLGRQIGAVGGLAILVMLVFWAALANLTSLDVPLPEFVASRLMRSFDSLIYLSDTNLHGIGETSMAQWYFAPFLKVAGLFDQYYNGFNYVIAIEYFGFTGDSTPLLPNNTQVGEVFVSFPTLVAPFAAALFGLAYGALYVRACAYVVRGGPLILAAAFVASSPFGFLIDGQGFFIAFICALILCAVAGVLWLPRVRIGLRRRHHSSPRLSHAIH